MNKMINDLKNTWLKVIKTPGDFFEQMPVIGGYADPVKFAAICYLIAGIGMSIITLVEGSTPGGVGWILSYIILLPVIGVIGIFIGGFIIHIFFKILGGKGTYEGTVRLLAYSSAVAVFSWIPFLFILPDLYMIYMAVIGGTKVHKISTTRSLIAVVTPLIIVIVLIGAIVFVIFSIGGMSLDPSVMSKYNFNIEVSTDSKLEKPTFYLPLPVFKDGSKLGDEAIIQNTGNPDGWDLSMIETEHGKMLKISAIKIEPELHQEIGLSPPGFGQTDDTMQGDVHSFMRGYKEFQASWTSGHVINITSTADIVPLLYPKFNLTVSNNDTSYPTGRIPLKTQKYESYIYADYTAAPKANIQVCVTLYGINQLWAGNLVFNNYRDNFCTEFTGKKHGWIPVTGEIVQRVMPYNKAENSKSVEWVPVSNEKRTSTLTDDT
ncbi:MAG: YIP1 family protein [Bacteroidota bacterium]